MRLACVGDVHGHQNLSALRADLEGLGPADLILLAGDLTDRNDMEAYGVVLRTIREYADAPMIAVFGNNEYSESYGAYRERFADSLGVRFLHDESLDLSVHGRRIRVVGSLGSLDRPTWWQRKNMPSIAGEYTRRIALLDRLLDGEGFRVLLTHYPPTYATMGDEKDEWRPELGCRALEPILVRRRPDLVIHGHVHKGIAHAEIAKRGSTLDAFADPPRSIPVYNVAYPACRRITVLNL